MTWLLPYTVFIFLHKKMQAVCLQMLEAQNIPFVCGDTDWMAQFQSNYEMQPGMPGERERERITLRALLSQKPESCTLG